MKKFLFVIISLFLLFPVATFATTNLDTTFDITTFDFDLSNYSFKDGTYNNMQEFYDSINNMESEYYNKVFAFGVSYGNLFFRVYLIPKSVSFLEVNGYTSSINYQFNYYFSSPEPFYFYTFRNDRSLGNLSSLLNCLNNNSCSNAVRTISTSCDTNFNDVGNNYSSPSMIVKGSIYKSDVSLKILDSSSVSNDSWFFKSLIIDGVRYEPGDVFRPFIYDPNPIKEIKRPGIPKFSKIYVPNYEEGQCAYMYSSNILRVYDSVPTSNSTVNYTEYMVDNHYLYRFGLTSFSQYSTLPTCLDDEYITTNYGYRSDIADILIVFVIVVGVLYLIIRALYRALFKGGRIL